MRIRSLMKAAVAAVVATPIAGAQSEAAKGVEDFLAGSLVNALGSSAISDRARLAEMQLAQSGGAPGVGKPSPQPQALSIAVCSLNECSDTACAPNVGSPKSPQPQALSIAVCSLNECSDTACANAPNVGSPQMQQMQKPQTRTIAC